MVWFLPKYFRDWFRLPLTFSPDPSWYVCPVPYLQHNTDNRLCVISQLTWYSSSCCLVSRPSPDFRNGLLHIQRKSRKKCSGKWAQQFSLEDPRCAPSLSTRTWSWCIRDMRASTSAVGLVSVRVGPYCHSTDCRTQMKVTMSCSLWRSFTITWSFWISTSGASVS